MPSILHGVTHSSIWSWQDGTSHSEIQAIRKNMTDVMAAVRALTPSNPALYLNEVSIRAARLDAAIDLM